MSIGILKADVKTCGLVKKTSAICSDQSGLHNINISKHYILQKYFSLFLDIPLGCLS